MGQYKVAFTLRGPPTLFAKLTPDQREEYYELRTRITGMEFRKKLVEELNITPESYPRDHAVKYRVGSRQHAVFHSEPDENVPRIFLQILLGNSQENINQWGDRYPMSRK